MNLTREKLNVDQKSQQISKPYFTTNYTDEENSQSTLSSVQRRVEALKSAKGKFPTTNNTRLSSTQLVDRVICIRKRKIFATWKNLYYACAFTRYYLLRKTFSVWSEFCNVRTRVKSALGSDLTSITSNEQDWGNSFTDDVSDVTYNTDVTIDIINKERQELKKIPRQNIRRSSTPPRIPLPPSLSRFKNPGIPLPRQKEKPALPLQNMSHNSTTNRNRSKTPPARRVPSGAKSELDSNLNHRRYNNDHAVLNGT
jgi:hypothetical protein